MKIKKRGISFTLFLNQYEDLNDPEQFQSIVLITSYEQKK